MDESPRTSNDKHSSEKKFLLKLTPVITGLIASCVLVLFSSLFSGLNNIVDVQFLDFLSAVLVFYFAVDLLLERYEIKRWRIVNRLERISDWVEQSEQTTDTKELALSLIYLKHYKRKHIQAKIALIMCSIALVFLSYKLPELNLLQLALPPIIVFALITLKERVVEYRIQVGLFATTISEVRDFLTFLVQNSEDIDFTGPGGGLRPVLKPKEPTETKTDARGAAGGAVA